MSDDNQRLRQLSQELATELELISGALAKAREKLARLDERLAPSGSAWPAQKRQARFYWGIFLAGGEPEGRYVSEKEVNAQLRKLTLDNKQETVAQMRKSIAGREGQHFSRQNGGYKLRNEALPVLREFRDNIEGIPAKISI